MDDLYNAPAYGWEGAEIENDSQFVAIENGEYEYYVKEFERGRYGGSDKIPACPQAILTLAVLTPQGEASCKVNLFLHPVVEWKLSEFFRSIGLKKHGEKLIMDWSKVPGARGRAVFGQREYTYEGEKKHANECKRFLDFDASKMKKNSGFQNIPAETDEEIPFD